MPETSCLIFCSGVRVLSSSESLLVSWLTEASERPLPDDSEGTGDGCAAVTAAWKRRFADAAFCVC